MPFWGYLLESPKIGDSPSLVFSCKLDFYKTPPKKQPRCNRQGDEVPITDFKKKVIFHL
jgi:hypothetical protein